MNHLIFGGSGFLGSHLQEFIKENYQNDQVYSYDIKNTASNDVRKKINIDIPDLSNSIIYHLAAVHITPGHLDHEYFETNVYGAEQVCDFATRAQIKTIIFTSSIAPYGPSEYLKDENTLPMPTTPYGISKLTAEYIFKAWQSADPKHRVLFIVRPGVIFGKNEGGNFSRLYNSLKKGFFFYPGRRDTIKACIYVKDVVKILYNAGQREVPGCETYNLTYNPAPTIEEICKAMAKVTNVKSPKVLVPGIALISAAGMMYYGAKALGKNINGIHPERVKKLMVSTNISGRKLDSSIYKLTYSLSAALKDWYNENEEKGLY
jgi:nucleoside-diphosphate-sugar epimerase